MRARDARVTVLPAPKKAEAKPPRKLKPGSEAARKAGCRCWASFRSLVTGGNWKLDPACPLGHTEADLEPLRVPGGMTGQDGMTGHDPPEVT